MTGSEVSRPKGQSKSSVSWGRWICLAVSLVFLVMVYRRIPGSGLQRALAHLHWARFLGAVVVFALAQCVAACRWGLMLRLQGVRVKPFAVWRATVAGHFFNTFLLGPAGGDLAKSAVFSRWHGQPTPEIVAASFLDRLVAGGGSLALGLLTLYGAVRNDAGAILQHLHFSWPHWWIWGALAGGLLLLRIVLRRHDRSRLFVQLTRGAIGRGLVSLVREFPIAVGGLILGFLTQALLSGVLALNLFAILNHPIPWLQVLWTFPLISALTSLPLSVAGMGVREGATLLLLAPLGVAPADAAAAALLTLIVYLLWAGVGGWLLWREEAAWKRNPNPSLPIADTTRTDTTNLG